MTRKRRTARRATRKLRVEHLEPRRVLDAQLGDLAGMVPSDEAHVAVQENAALVASGEGEADRWSTFETVEQLKAFFIEEAEQQWGHLFGEKTWQNPWVYRYADDAMMLDTVTVRPAAADMRNVVDYSQTNVQVAGVDEGDIVETDGRYLYLNGDQEIVVVDTASDSGLQVVSRVDVAGQPQAIYLANDRLSVISRPSFGYPQPVPMIADTIWEGPWSTEPQFVVTVVDVSDPAEPQALSQIQVEGDLIDSRMIGDTLYLVSDDSFFLPAPETTCSDSITSPPVQQHIDPVETTSAVFTVVRPPWIDRPSHSCTYETREEYWDRLGDDWLDMALPNYTTSDASGEVLTSNLLTSPEAIYRPLTDTSQRLVSVSAVDISAATPTILTSTSAPLDWASTLYVSQENLYVVSQTFDASAEGAGSAIYKFSLDAVGQGIDLAAAGHVPGRVLNQFSLDEHQGLLRIVTQQGWNASATSGLYVLDQVGDSLKTVGQIEDMAPGERLYSVRFVGDRAFVVTFGPINGAWFDPLFTIDLSEPTDPQVQGELEIPGFSNYLHLVSDDYLIGLGRNADETNGRSLEPQVSLFDVSDFDNPQLESRLSFGDVNRSWSEAFSEHLAVSFFPEAGILAIPMNTWPRWDFEVPLFQSDPLVASPVPQGQYSLFIFQVDVTAASDAIRLLGTIEHDSAIKRSLRIEDRLYSISRDTIQVHELVDPETALDALFYLRPSDKQRMVALAKIDLAERLGGQPGDMDVLTVESKHWPDGCLGLGGANEICTQAIVPGYEVTLAHERVQYVYRTDMVETVVLEETDQLEPLVRVRLEAVDQAGTPLTSIEAGGQFTVNIYVDDLRENGAGVFATYVDIFYPSRLMKADGEITFDGEYRNGVAGDVLPSGLIDEVGAFASLDELGEEERPLASIPFVALRGGLASLVLNPADELGYEVLLYGLDVAIPWNQVELVGTEFQIEGTLRNVELPTDVNDDGLTTALDALQCVNALNTDGSRSLAGSEARHGSFSDGLFYVDVNGDLDLTPEDALAIVNELNASSRDLDGQSLSVRSLAGWVDWQMLDTEFSEDDWAPLDGVGLGTHEMLDLSHEIFAELDRDHVRDHIPGDWLPRGVEQVRAALTVAQISPPIDPLADRLLAAAEDLQASIDGLDLHAVLPRVATNFDWDATREIFRDRLFARISDTAFLDDVLE